MWTNGCEFSIIKLMIYTFIFMKNSQTNKPPVTITIPKGLFWFLTCLVSFLLAVTLYCLYVFILPASLHSQVLEYKDQSIALTQENDSLKNKNDELLIENGTLRQNIESELTKVAELQAQANIVEKIKKESLEEISKYSQKLAKQNQQIEFYKELMSPPIKQELQCFNMNVKYGKKFVDYGINLVLDNKNENGRSFDVEFRLLSGTNNVELTETMPEDLAPDTIRKITMKNSIRLTGKIKHNNKLSALKVLDVRVFNKSKDLVAQCWKVF